MFFIKFLNTLKGEKKNHSTCVLKIKTSTSERLLCEAQFCVHFYYYFHLVNTPLLICYVHIFSIQDLIKRDIDNIKII